MRGAAEGPDLAAGPLDEAVDPFPFDVGGGPSWPNAFTSVRVPRPVSYLAIRPPHSPLSEPSQSRPLESRRNVEARCPVATVLRPEVVDYRLDRAFPLPAAVFDGLRPVDDPEQTRGGPADPPGRCGERRDHGRFERERVDPADPPVGQAGEHLVAVAPTQASERLWPARSLASRIAGHSNRSRFPDVVSATSVSPASPTCRLSRSELRSK